MNQNPENRIMYQIMTGQQFLEAVAPQADLLDLAGLHLRAMRQSLLLVLFLVCQEQEKIERNDGCAGVKHM